MKAEIVMDPVSKAGILKIKPESSMEAFALHHWWQRYTQGVKDSILTYTPFPEETQ